MRKVVIFTGGAHPGYDRFAAEFEADPFVIAADSGYDTAREYGVKVDLCLGDMDSIRSRIENSSLVLTYEKDKDQTDTELALFEASARKAEQIILIGGGEGRLDHTVSLLTLFAGEICPTRWYTALECVHVVDKEVRINLHSAEERKVAVLGINTEPSYVWSKNLFWELSGYRIDCTHHSISNRSVAPKIELQVRKGPRVLLSVGY